MSVLFFLSYDCLTIHSVVVINEHAIFNRPIQTKRYTSYDWNQLASSIQLILIGLVKRMASSAWWQTNNEHGFYWSWMVSSAWLTENNEHGFTVGEWLRHHRWQKNIEHGFTVSMRQWGRHCYVNYSAKLIGAVCSNSNGLPIHIQSLSTLNNSLSSIGHNYNVYLGRNY
jgi:hypothetical protein